MSNNNFIPSALFEPLPKPASRECSALSIYKAFIWLSVASIMAFVFAAVLSSSSSRRYTEHGQVFGKLVSTPQRPNSSKTRFIFDDAVEDTTGVDLSVFEERPLDDMAPFNLSELLSTTVGPDSTFRTMDDTIVNLEGVPRLTKVIGDRDTIVFNRVPKCGGTTVTAIFETLSKENHFKLRKLKTLLQTSPNMDEKYLGRLLEKVSRDREGIIYVGHVHFVKFTDFGQSSPVYLNMIRDPFERMVSDYYFRRSLCLRWMSHKKKCPARYMQYLKETFDECVSHKRNFCYRPNTTGYFKVIPFFCGNTHDRETCLKDSSEALQIAKKNVERFYTAVGLTEDIERFLEIIEGLLPRYFANLTALYRQSSGGKDKPLFLNKGSNKIPPKQKTIDTMHKVLHNDYEFYNFIKQRFYQQHREVINL